MFRAFLKVADHCPACGEALHHHRADDAPAYFVILIVGHIVVPLVLVGRDRLRAALLGACRALAAADARALASLCCSRSRARSSACNGRCACTASIRRRPTRRTRTEPHHRTAPMSDINSDRIERLNDFVRRMNAVDRDLSHKVVRPKDAATLILVDRSGRDAEGAARQAPCTRTNSCRASSCFPGGGVEPTDQRMPVATPARSAVPKCG